MTKKLKKRCKEVCISQALKWKVGPRQRPHQKNNNQKTIYNKHIKYSTSIFIYKIRRVAFHINAVDK